MEDQVPQSPNLYTDYRQPQSTDDLTQIIEGASQQYAMSDNADTTPLYQSVRRIAMMSAPYEKPRYSYTSDDVAMLGERLRAIKSATNLARTRYKDLGITSDDELNGFVAQAEADYYKAMNDVLHPMRDKSFLEKVAQGQNETFSRMSTAIQQLFDIGDQEELNRKTAYSNMLLEDPTVKMSNIVSNVATAVPATMLATALLPETALGVGVGGLLGTALRTAPYAVEGVVQGALQPTEEGESRSANVVSSGLMSTALKPVVEIGSKAIDLVKPQKYVARDTARMLLEDLPKGEQGQKAEQLIRGIEQIPSTVVPEARLTTPEYLASQGVEAPTYNQLQDFLRNQPQPETNAFPFLDAERQTAEAVDKRIVEAFGGATPEDAMAIRQLARETEGKLIEKARQAKLPINATGVVRYIDKFVKDNPTLDFTPKLQAYRASLMRDIPIETRVRQALKQNRDFLTNQRVISSTKEKDAIALLDDIIKQDSVDITYKNGIVKTYDTTTLDGKVKAMSALSRQLKTKTGKDHARAVYETLTTGQVPYDRIRDLHNIKMNLQAEMDRMTPYQRKVMFPMLKKIDSAISAEWKDWGEYMKSYAVQMNKASQVEAGAIIRGGITDTGMSNMPKLNITSFKDLVRKADEKYLKSRFGNRIRFTPDQSQAMTEIRNTARALQSVRTIGRDVNSQTAQRLRTAQRMDPEKVLNTPFEIAKTGAFLVGRIDRRKLPEVYKMMADPYYFAEILRNTPAKDRYAVHALRSALIGFQTPILTSNLGKSYPEMNQDEMSDAEYQAFMQLSPEQQMQYLDQKNAMESQQAPSAGIVTK